MAEDLKAPPLWKVWANPIFVRYARSRLRPAALLPWIVVVLIASAFSFFLLYVFDINQGYGRERAADDAFFPVLVIQMVILLLMGTGSVASGITTEADDGMIEYQRLTPMSPLAKIIGYLFGLPIREYVLFACTLPFTAYAVSAGTMELNRVLLIYFILFVSAILYHLTGCVAGTVVKKRRVAGRLAQLMVVLLYFVLPYFGRFVGFVFFEYLTLRPVMFEQLANSQAPAFSGAFAAGSRIPVVNFFNIEFSKPEFSLLIQGSLIATFVVILFRKWRQQTHHVLGKDFAVALFSYIMLLLVGNAVPLIRSGKIFSGMLYPPDGGLYNPLEAYFLSALFGLGALVLGFSFISSITPTQDEYTKGLRRARKLGKPRIPLGADGASAVWHALAIGVFGAVCWSYFSTQIFGAPAVRQVEHREQLLKFVPAGLLIYVLCYHGMLERFGRRALLLFALFVWIVPILVGIIMVAASIKGLPALLGGLSAFASPFYLLVLPLQDEDILRTTGRTMQIGAAFGLFAHSLLAVFLSWSLSRHKKRIRERVEGEKLA